jgi:hypothetical protein
MPLCGRVIAGRPGTRQVPHPVVPSPLGILTQRQVGLSVQRGPELLVADGLFAGRTVRAGASLVGHVGPSSTLTPERRSGSRRGSQGSEIARAIIRSELEIGCGPVLAAVEEAEPADPKVAPSDATWDLQQ